MEKRVQGEIGMNVLFGNILSENRVGSVMANHIKSSHLSRQFPNRLEVESRAPSLQRNVSLCPLCSALHKT